MVAVAVQVVPVKNWFLIEVEPEPPTLGLAIRQGRGSLIQKEIAEQIGVSTNQYGKYENDSARPTDATLSRLEELFGLPPDTLFDVEVRHQKWERGRRNIPASGVVVPQGLTIHHLRHTHITHLVLAGVPLVEVARRVGHARADITLQKYSHLMPGYVGSATQAVTTALYGEAAPATHPASGRGLSS